MGRGTQREKMGGRREIGVEQKRGMRAQGWGCCSAGPSCHGRGEGCVCVCMRVCLCVGLGVSSFMMSLPWQPQGSCSFKLLLSPYPLPVIMDFPPCIPLACGALQGADPKTDTSTG